MGFAWESPKLGQALTLLGLTPTAYTPGFVTFRCPHCGRSRQVATSTVYRWAGVSRVPKCQRWPDCPPFPPPSTPTSSTSGSPPPAV